MGFSGRFSASEVAGEEAWQGPLYGRLAGLCDRAGLTVREAEIVNLYARGLSLRQIGEQLGIVKYKIVVWRHLHRASAKIARQAPALGDRRREWAWMVLDCVRNSSEGGGRAATAYDPQSQRWIPLRARILTPEDLGGGAPGLLEALLEALSDEFQPGA